MKKYLAVVKKPSYSKPVSLHLDCEDVRQAIDRMYTYVGATTARDIEEYQIYEVIGPSRYVPVAQKLPTVTKMVDLPAAEDVSEDTRPFKIYSSYRDVA